MGWWGLMKAGFEADEVLHGEFCIGYPPIDCTGELTIKQVGEEWAAQLGETVGGGEAIA